jgi:hypothetical protein
LIRLVFCIFNANNDAENKVHRHENKMLAIAPRSFASQKMRWKILKELLTRTLDKSPRIDSYQGRFEERGLHSSMIKYPAVNPNGGG